MPELGRAQIVVYAAVAVAVLLLGARWVGNSVGGETQAVFGAPEQAGAAEGGHGKLVNLVVR